MEVINICTEIYLIIGMLLGIINLLGSANTKDKRYGDMNFILIKFIFIMLGWFIIVASFFYYGEEEQ